MCCGPCGYGAIRARFGFGPTSTFDPKRKFATDFSLSSRLSIYMRIASSAAAFGSVATLADICGEEQERQPDILRVGFSTLSGSAAAVPPARFVGSGSGAISWLMLAIGSVDTSI